MPRSVDNGKGGGVLVGHRQLSDLRRRVLFWKSIVFTAWCASGAAVGSFLGDSSIWAGLAAGAVLGLFAVNCLTWLLPSFNRPMKNVLLSFRDYRRIRRRYVSLFYLFFGWATLGILAMDDSIRHQLPGRLWLAWLAILACLFLLGTLHYGLLEGWHCPICGEHFRVRSVFDPYPHFCEQCGLKITQRQDHLAVIKASRSDPNKICRGQSRR